LQGTDTSKVRVGDELWTAGPVITSVFAGSGWLASKREKAWTHWVEKAMVQKKTREESFLAWKLKFPRRRGNRERSSRDVVNNKLFVASSPKT